MKGPMSGRLLAAALLSAALLSGGCGSNEDALEAAGLDSEYVSVALTQEYVVLMLGDDGSFAVIRDTTEPYCDTTMRRGPEPVGHGEWTFSDGRLDLKGDGWTVVFESDSTRVEIPDRSDTLSSLRWVTSSEGSPFEACDLVSASEFQEFLHPTEGAGGAGM